MPVQQTNDPELLIYVSENPQVILNYHSEICETSSQIFNFYRDLSEDARFSNILFLSINSKQNPIATKHLEGKPASIVSIYRQGRLLDTCLAASREQMEQLLQKLVQECS